MKKPSSVAENLKVATVIVDPQEAVVAVLRKRPHGPAELMVLIQQGTKLDDLTIKDAVADLLDRRIIEFSPDRKLRLRAEVRKVS